MNTKYRLGRSDFRTLKDGMEKEWLVTHGIGGFANGCVAGANHRLFSGYLTASFHPPVDRKVVWSGTHEAVSFPEQQREVDLAAQAYVGEERNGQVYLNSFELDVVPIYIYQVDDMTIRKTIGMSYGRNAAAVTYEIEAGKEGGEFHITPLFKFTNPGEGAEKSQLDFRKEISGSKLTLVPKEDEKKK